MSLKVRGAQDQEIDQQPAKSKHTQASTKSSQQTQDFVGSPAFGVGAPLSARATVEHLPKERGHIATAGPPRTNTWQAHGLFPVQDTNVN